MKTIQSLLNNLTGSPLKSVLTLLTVGLGVGVLILAMSISSFLSKVFSSELEREGIVVTFANAEYNDEGELERVRPPQMDENVIDIVRSEVAGVVAVAPVAGTFWNKALVGDWTYRIRTAVSSTEDYARVMGLEPVAGTFFTAEDVERGRKVVMISESLAKLLFGSAGEALGAVIQPPALELRTRDASGRESRTQIVQSFTVVGVFADIGELRRKSYGVADLVIPYTAALPAGSNIQMARRFLLSTIVVKVRGLVFATVEAQIREVLTREYGDDLELAVWEGNPQGESTTIDEARRTVDTFTLVVNILGFVLLITGSIGILSIMLVEVLGRTKEISLERALGASRSAIITEYFSRSILLSLMSAAIGIAISLVFAKPLTQVLLPLFETMGVTRASNGVLHPLAIFIGTAVALVIGAVFGVFPVLSTLKTDIAEGIREV